MAPISIEETSGALIDVSVIQYEPTPGEMIDVGEAWYENPRGTLTRVFTTRRTDIRWNCSSFAPIPGGGYYVLNDAEPSRYYTPESRVRLQQQGYDPNIEGRIHVEEGLYRLDANGVNIGGSRVEGLHNRAPSAICLMPDGELVWASGDGDTLPIDFTLFSRYAIEDHKARLIANVDIYDTDPNRNTWRHRILPTPAADSHIHVQSAAAWSANEVVMTILERTEPFSTFVRTQVPVAPSGFRDEYVDNRVLSSFTRDRIVRVGLHNRSFETLVASSDSSDVPISFYGIATNGSDIWASGTSLAQPGRWIIYHLSAGSTIPNARLFTPYGNNDWPVDMHYVSDTEIRVLFAQGQGEPLHAIGSNNSFITAFNPTANTWFPAAQNIHVQL